MQGDIPTTVRNIAFQVFGHALLRIINTSFVTKTVPSSWKMAEVIPLHKRDDAGAFQMLISAPRDDT